MFKNENLEKIKLKNKQRKKLKIFKLLDIQY